FIELTESSFARMVSSMRRKGWERFVLGVQFTQVEPEYRRVYERVFAVPLAFGAARNAIRLDEAFFSVRFPPTNRYVFGGLSERAAALLKRLESAETLRGRVEALLMPVLHTGNFGADDIAAKLGISRPTLFRKLRAESTSFAKILDELRQRL